MNFPEFPTETCRKKICSLIKKINGLLKWVCWSNIDLFVNIFFFNRREASNGQTIKKAFIWTSEEIKKNCVLIEFIWKYIFFNWITFFFLNYWWSSILKPFSTHSNSICLPKAFFISIFSFSFRSSTNKLINPTGNSIYIYSLKQWINSSM